MYKFEKVKQNKIHNFNNGKDITLPLIYTCCHCGRTTTIVYADLNGISFVDYYCTECKEVLIEKNKL